ncbi:MAG: hypothetical protein IJ754_09575 [Bacteroidaceae bacterium]|nr:hypothetical protein [Bacteroidaceae bacterium]
MQAATAAVTGATWTANDAEVNAIWDGSFEHDYSGQSGNVQPIGWYRNEGTYTGDGYNVRYVTVPSGVEGNTSGHGLFGKFTMQYGKESGYTLPLKEGYYKLSFSYGGYGEQGERIVKLIGDSEMTIATVKAKNNQANTKADAYTAFSQVIKVPAAGNYVLSFYRQNTTSQNQIAVVDIKLFRATTEDLKPMLAEEITTAGKIDTEHNVGTAAFQIPAAAVTALTSEITAAQAVYDDAEATADEVSDAIADLQAAEAIELNTPDPAQAYHLVFNCDGHTATGNALTLIPNPSQTQGLYGLKYLAPANVNLAQAFYFVHTTGNKYKVYAVDTDGNDRYITTQAEGYGTTWYEGIRTITDAGKAMEIEIRPNGEGLYLLWNTGANKALAHNGTNNNDLFTNNTANFQFVATTKPSIDINTTALGWATTMLPFAVAELPEGVKAYTCAAVNGTTLVLNEVTELEANKPYIIEGEWVETLTGDAQGQELTYTEGLLTGTYAEIDAINGTYILQKQDEKVAFYHVNTDVAQPKVPANRCYLTYSADPGVKMFILEDMATGVNLVPGEGVTVNGSEIYNLAGQKLSKTQKGVNIIGGKKVIIK